MSRLLDSTTGGTDFTVPDGTLQPLRAIELMHLDMNVWRNYGRGMGYLKNNEILEGIKRHRANLDKALGMVGVRRRPFSASIHPDMR